MNALNTALNENLPGVFPQIIRGGFFSCIELQTITPDTVALFVSTAGEAGIGIAPAWDAVAPNLRTEKQNKGLLEQLSSLKAEIMTDTAGTNYMVFGSFLVIRVSVFYTTGRYW